MTKCMNKSPGGCLVKHGAKYVTGLGIGSGWHFSLIIRFVVVASRRKLVQFAIIVRPSFAMGDSVFLRMRANARFKESSIEFSFFFAHIILKLCEKTASVLNVSAQCGTMGVECSNVLFALAFYAKMISSSIKQSVKS